MIGFFDATCTKCGNRFGWQGELKDKPPCPECGHWDKPATEDVEKLMEFDRLQAIGYDANGSDLGLMQKWSGLSYGQLAKRLGIPKSVVENIVTGFSAPGPDLCREWVDVCGFGEKDTE